jgi:Uma2 family endonuclease
LILAADDGIVGEVAAPSGLKQIVGGTRPLRQLPSRRRRNKMTVQEYLRTPETVLPQELAYGKFRVADAPLPNHQRAVARLFRALDDHVSAHGLGEVYLSPIDVILDAERHLVVQPDLLFISNARQRIVVDRIRGAPDLVVEVLSPNPRIGHTNERIGWFAAYGVSECWLLHLQSRRLEVLTMGGGTVTRRSMFEECAAIVSPVLPGFSRTLETMLGS